jgi:hypothetical protein
MVRKKIRVPEQVEFGEAVAHAAKSCVVVSEDSKRRSFVVECDDERHLETLRDLGCEIFEDRSYDIDGSAPEPCSRC